MARLCGAVAMTHNPRIYWNAEAAGEEDRQAVQSAFGEARDAVAAGQPDLVIAIANDHLDQFYLDTLPPFAVGVAERVAGPFWYEKEVMRLPTYGAPSAPRVAEDLLYAAAENGKPVTRCESFSVDHAFTVPLSESLPRAEVPVVPVFVNTFGPPLPSALACFGLGKLIGEFIESRPATERIAVVSSFNLSVDVGGPCMGQRHTVFDERIMSWIAEGDVDHLIGELTPRYLTRHGNSTAEFLNFHVVLGLLGECKPDRAWYRLVEGWGGCPVVTWRLPGQG